jgi:hypothetical protein
MGAPAVSLSWPDQRGLFLFIVRHPTCEPRGTTMARPAPGRGGLDLASWLTRKIKHGNLRGLPPFPALGGGIIHQPEPYARLLLGALRQPPDNPRDAERIRDDARAFRSWVEYNQIDLLPNRPLRPRHSPRPGANGR